MEQAFLILFLTEDDWTPNELYTVWCISGHGKEINFFGRNYDLGVKEITWAIS